MAGLTRETSIQFGSGGPASAFGQFGSKVAMATQTSQDPAVIQALAAWTTGWQLAVVAGNKAAYIQDMNGYCFVMSWMITYILQMGIPEYDAATLYFTGSVVQDAASGRQYRSLQGGVPGAGAGQSANALPGAASNAFWQWVNPPQDLVGTATLNTVPKVTSTAPTNGVPGSVTLGDSAISDDGVDVILALPLKFADNSIQTKAAVPVSAQNIVTGSRSLDTVFHNTGTKPLFVLVTMTEFQGNQISVLTDANAVPVAEVARIWADIPPGGMNLPIFFVVLPGNYYKIATSGGGLSSMIWTEWS